ncbi:hypothetical protein HYR54_05590 [Candidatus Acetothermia bacterium]|nr:hypothetical protein [Candidatus Acetothermia bacterium]MBI3461193.1 hypothetical protein [Candidatus Acetothermia bacterium]MBI3660612.1 hypothetical protein [Candidatus Acetothermia bacterium]
MLRSMLVIALVLSSLLGIKALAWGQPSLGVGLKIPLQLYASLGITDRLSFEMGVPLALGTNSSLAAVGQLKLMVWTFDVAGFETVPYIGVGGHVGVETQGGLTIIKLLFHALAGVDFPIPNTSFTILGEVWVMAGEGLSLVYNIGLRYDF